MYFLVDFSESLVLGIEFIEEIGEVFFWGRLFEISSDLCKLLFEVLEFVTSLEKIFSGSKGLGCEGVDELEAPQVTEIVEDGSGLL